LISFTTTGSTVTALPPAATQAAQMYPPLPVLPHLGRLAANYTCPYCSHVGPTILKEKLGVCSIIAIVVLVVVFWPLFWLPLIMPGCKDKEHICPNCHRKVRATAGMREY